MLRTVMFFFKELKNLVNLNTEEYRLDIVADIENEAFHLHSTLLSL